MAEWSQHGTLGEEVQAGPRIKCIELQHLQSKAALSQTRMAFEQRGTRGKHSDLATKGFTTFTLVSSQVQPAPPEGVSSPVQHVNRLGRIERKPSTQPTRLRRPNTADETGKQQN